MTRNQAVPTPVTSLPATPQLRPSMTHKLPSRFVTVLAIHSPRRTVRLCCAGCMLRWLAAAATQWFALDRTSMNLISNGLGGERAVCRRPAAGLMDSNVRHRASTTPTSNLARALSCPWPCTSDLQPPGHCFLGWHNTHQAVARGVHATSAAQLERSAVIRQDYDASQIQVLEGLDPVRKRPGMYIGSTGQRGLHHLVYEILDNAIDEVQAGHAKTVTVELDLDGGWVRISDDGRGIPTDMHPVTGKSALETVLTVLHAGGKFGGGNSGYKVSGGLHGVGISVVNALSEQLDVTVWRKGLQYSQSFQQGAPVGVLHQQLAQPNDASKRGTELRFLFDKSIFSENIKFDAETIRTRVREVAFLNSSATIRFLAAPGAAGANGLTISQSLAAAAWASSGNGSSNGASHDISSRSGSQWETFHSSGGLKEYVQYNNRDNATLHEPICISRTVDGVHVELALQWCSDMYSDSLIGFVNSIKTIDGGTHMDGFKAALTRLVNALGRKLKTLKEGDSNLSGDHVREGLAAIVSVKVPNPEFEGQTKTRLGNPEVRRIVEGIVTQDIGEALEMEPTILQAVLSKALQAQRAAEAAKKARELVRRKSVLSKSTLPGKLADCSSTDRAISEIFLVEGDSAGGSAKMARDRVFQAILPLRGKILNVERSDDASLYKNNEIASLIVALGLGTKGESVEGLRYGKVIILTDADVDGAHIRTLLLTFLFRYCRALFESGHVFVGMPPLYKVTFGKGKPTYCYDDAELRTALAGHATGSYTLQRFKGLGEMMPEQLWATTLNPATRMLKRLTIDDAAEASHMFTLLMGDKVAPRRALIEAHGASIEHLDI